MLAIPFQIGVCRVTPHPNPPPQGRRDRRREACGLETRVVSCVFTLALMQAGQQGNAALSRTTQGQLNTLQLALQQSIVLQNALQMQSNQLTPEQLLALSQEQRTLSSLLTTRSVPLPNKTPGGRTH
jgi:hypothetical protein